MNLITQLFLLAISVASFFLFTNPHYKNVEDLKVQAAAYEKALESAKEADSIKQELIAKYNTFSADDLANLEKLLPDTVDNIRLLLDINQVANTYGSSISAIQITSNTTNANTATATDKPYGSIIIQFNVTMRYEDFIKFTQDLEQNLRITDVSALTFTGVDTGLYTYAVTLRTYWLK